MKHASLLAAAAIVLVANTFALVHAWRNRSGPVETDITLTERELPMSYSLNEDGSGVSLDLRWLDPAWASFGWERPALWLDQKALQELGFDTSVAASDDKATEFYQRQRARRAFVAVEYDGPAWRKHVEDAERQDQQRAELSHVNIPPHSHEAETHLVAIDASTDPVHLRARHPDRNSVIIVPAVVRIAVDPFSPASGGRPSRAARLSGSVQQIPSSIHVPRPFSDAFRRLPKDRSKVRYQGHLRYGASYEPWIVGVEFTTLPNQ
jgi:Domain of unknown function (DUF4824)